MKSKNSKSFLESSSLLHYVKSFLKALRLNHLMSKKPFLSTVTPQLTPDSLFLLILGDLIENFTNPSRPAPNKTIFYFILRRLWWLLIQNRNSFISQQTSIHSRESFLEKKTETSTFYFKPSLLFDPTFVFSPLHFTLIKTKHPRTVFNAHINIYIYRNCQLRI